MNIFMMLLVVFVTYHRAHEELFANKVNANGMKQLLAETLNVIQLINSLIPEILVKFSFITIG